MISPTPRQHAAALGLIQAVILAGICWSARLAAQQPAPPPAGRPADSAPLVLPSGLADYQPAIQAAIDALPATGGTIELPAGNLPLASPLRIDRNGVTLRGRGKDTVLQARGYFHPIILGVPRDAGLSADHRFDLSGVLDASAAPAPGRAWGVDTKADRWLSWWAVPPATGMRDGWRGVKALTIDACLAEMPSGQNVALFGMGSYVAPSPWYFDVYYEPSAKGRLFRYRELTADGVGHTLTFGPADGLPAGPVRISFQRDLKAGTAAAWVNGVAAAVKVWGAPPPAGAAFAPNKVAPFQVGNGDVIQSDWRPQGWARPDLKIAGLSLTASADYATIPPGGQVRTDGGPLDDQYRYASTTRNVIARLALSDPPEPGAAGQVVRMIGGPNNLGGSFWGLFLPGPAVVPSRLAIEDLTVACQNGVGQGVAVGQCLDVSLTDLRSGGGWQGVGSLNCGAVYMVRLRGDTRLSGADCAYYGNSQVIRADRVNLGYVANAGVRLVGCDAAFDGLFGAAYVNHPSCLAECLAGGYAGRYSIGELWVDQEGGNSEPAVVCEKHPGALTTLDVGVLGAGLRDATTPMIDLRDPSPSGGVHGGGLCIVRGPVRHTSGVVVRQQGDWQSSVSGTSPWPNAANLVPVQKVGP